MRSRRVRVGLALAAVAAAGLAILAIVDRGTAVLVLYVLGGALLAIGAFTSMGGGPSFQAGMEREQVRILHHDMRQRIRWQGENMLLIAAGAVLFGLGVLLDVGFR